MKKYFIISTLILLFFVGYFVYRLKNENGFLGHYTKNPSMDANAMLATENPSVIDKQLGLSSVVEETRQRIAEAAVKGNYESLALVAGQNIKYTLGGEHEGGFGGWLKSLDEKQGNSKTFQNILEVLEQPHTLLGDTYVWPAVVNKSAAEWTEVDIENMRLFTTDGEIERWRALGAYNGYRIGIKYDGTWVYYLAGD